MNKLSEEDQAILKEITKTSALGKIAVTLSWMAMVFLYALLDFVMFGLIAAMPVGFVAWLAGAESSRSAALMGGIVIGSLA